MGFKKKKDPSVCCLQETQFRYKITKWLKAKGQKIYIPYK